jgi:dTDP-4-dehydrorhamnose 3,5-epimerase
VKVTAPPALPERRLFHVQVFHDSRGRFLELHHEERYAGAGVDARFVQDNVSVSKRHVLRGLHFQHPRAQGKLISVLEGEVFDVAVDVRRGSPTFARWVGFTLSGENAAQLWIPPGFAHGFVVTGEHALVAYKCTEPYVPAAEHTVRWDDPEIGIEWPVTEPELSLRDATAPTLAALPEDALPRWQPARG